MKKVIVINPRGIKGDEEYLNGMVSALYKRNDIDVSLYTNFYYEIPDEDIPYKCHRYFFKNSEKMVPSTKRNAVRAAEYINQYLKLINIIKKEIIITLLKNYIIAKSKKFLLIKSKMIA